MEDSACPPFMGKFRRVTYRGESGFGIANDRGTVAVEWQHHRCDRLKRRRDLSVEVSVLRGWDPKVPVGSPVSFPKRSNPAWRLVAPSSPCRINTKSKHHTNFNNNKAWPMEGHYWVPSLFSTCSNQALRPGPPPKPLSN